MTHWTLLPTLVVRTAGFPWQLVDGLAYPRTAAALDTLDAIESEAARLRAGLGPVRLTRGQAARLRTGRALDTGGPLPAGWLAEWNAQAANRLVAGGELASALDADRSTVDAFMGTVLADPRFRDAVVCSSPGVHRDLSRGPVGSGRLRRQIASYVQRFAAKCETMSFFGPVNYGRVGSGATKVDWPGYAVCLQRRAYVSAWLFQSILTVLCGQPEVAALVVPRRKLLRRPPGPNAGAAVRRLVAGADGTRTVGEIAGAAQLPVPAAAAALVAAVHGGYLTHDLEPPASVVDPLRWLAGRIAIVAPDAAPPLRDAVALLDRYPAAYPDEKVDLQRRLGQLGADGPTRRRGGRFYHDRLPVHEAAAGALTVDVGGDLARDLTERVAPVLDLLAADAEQTRRLTNHAVAVRLGTGRFPLVVAMRACADVPVVPADLLAGAVRAVLREVPPDTVDVDLAGRLPVPPPPELPVLCSVDVMVATADLTDYASGRTPLVLSDVHDAPLLTPWALQFHADAPALLAERDAAIRTALGRVRAISVVARRTTGLPSWELPGLVLELGPASGDAPAVALDDLYVDSDGERAVLGSTRYGAPLVWHNGELDTGFHTAFALPRVRRPSLVDGTGAPRLRWGSVVLSRRRWRVERADLDRGRRPGTDADRLATAHRLWRARGWPRRCFAKSPNERKPVYVDATSPALLDGWYRLATDAPWLDLTELLPGPDGQWLRDGALRFAAELRCVYLRPGGGPP